MNIYTKVDFLQRSEYFDVYVLYTRTGKKFRAPTGVKVSPKYLTKTKTISTGHPGYQHDLLRIQEAQQRMESLIADYIAEFHVKPPVAWLEQAYTDKVKAEQAQRSAQETQVASVLGQTIPLHAYNSSLALHENRSTTLATLPLIPPPANKLPAESASPSNDGSPLDEGILSHWDDFMKEKREIARNEKGPKRFQSSGQIMRTYLSRRQSTVTFCGLVQAFFNDFVKYAIEEHQHFKTRKKGIIPKGMKPIIGLSNDTAIKVIKDIRDYLQYCSIEKDVPINLGKIDRYIKIAKKKYSVRPLPQKQRWELWLSLDELQFVINLDYMVPDFYETLSENQIRYLDIIIFMCLQGTSPVDTQGITRYDVVDHQIIKDRSKTYQEFEVNLDPIAEEILIKYNYDLTFTEQSMNDEVKRLFVTIFELYRIHFEQRTGKPYKILCTQKFYKGEELVVRIAHRGLYAENMMGRRTFMNNRKKQATTEELMDEVGHTKPTTHKSYIFGDQQQIEQRGTLGVARMRKDDLRRSA